MSIFEPLWRLVTDDIAIDLGTSNTKMAIRGRGDVITEPTVVALDSKSGEIVAVGKSAKKMLGRTPPGIVAVRPLRNGIVSDFETTRDMIQYFIELATRASTHFLKIPRPRVVIGVPLLASEVGREAIRDAAKNAGARICYIIEEPRLAAIGAGLPVTEAVGSMIVDIGGGTSDIAIISLGGIVVDKTIPIAGDEMDAEIVKYLKYKYNILTGERIAEDIKIKIGSAYPVKQDSTYEVRGRDTVQGIPKTMEISSIEVREALHVPLNLIASSIIEALEEAPPEILSDIAERGICLAGGGSLLPGIKEYFEERVKMNFYVADEPMLAVLKGAKAVLEDLDLLTKLKVGESE